MKSRILRESPLDLAEKTSSQKASVRGSGTENSYMEGHSRYGRKVVSSRLTLGVVIKSKFRGCGCSLVGRMLAAHAQRAEISPPAQMKCGHGMIAVISALQRRRQEDQKFVIVSYIGNSSLCLKANNNNNNKI